MPIGQVSPRANDKATMWRKALKYSEMESIDPGLKFTTLTGIMVETTGITVSVESVGIYVHEVIIIKNPGEGNKYLHNLDSAKPV